MPPQNPKHEQDGQDSVSSRGVRFDIDESHPECSEWTDDESSIRTSSREVVEAELARRETRAVNILRGIVVIILVVAGTFGSIYVHTYTSAQQQDDFNQAFTSYATKILDSVKLNIEKQLEAMDSFSLTLTSYANDRNLTWPFVTLPDYERRAQKILSQVNGLSLLMAPFVSDEDQEEWERYSVDHFDRWFDKGLQFQLGGGYNNRTIEGAAEHENNTTNENQHRIAETIVYLSDGNYVPDSEPGVKVPLWQNAPVNDGAKMENSNLARKRHFAPGINLARSKLASLGVSLNLNAPDPTEKKGVETIRKHIDLWGYDVANNEPSGSLFYPLFEGFDHDESRSVGVLIMVIHWKRLFEDILPSKAAGVVVVMENTCGQSFSYLLEGSKAKWLPPGTENTALKELAVETTILEAFEDRRSDLYTGVSLTDGNCQYSVKVFPTSAVKKVFVTSDPLIFTLIVAAIFVFAGAILFTYDLCVEKRQRLVMRNARRSGAIVSSLFPASIRDRLMHEDEEMGGSQSSAGYTSNHTKLKSILSSSNEMRLSETMKKPLAEFFPETTVAFIDIANFTAWSSARDPTQVFLLLQTLYQGFDKLSNQLGVFKVETVGDCYVAVTGLPTPQTNHAVIMARFAYNCIQAAHDLTKKLEVSLGPDTGDLRVRAGLHSGPVTAGILRADRTRFQIFGDTVNMASRMESHGVPSAIHTSKATVDLLTAAGKGHWVLPRTDKVKVKGKGIVKTYFLNPEIDRICYDSSLVHSLQANCLIERDTVAAKKERLVKWNAELILGHLKTIIACRQLQRKRRSCDSSILQVDRAPGSTCLDEVEDVIKMPNYDSNVVAIGIETGSVSLSDDVRAQVYSFVAQIASMYMEHPFHNFEASHVTMSVDKLTKRIVTPDIDTKTNATQKDLHDFTHGITSDPLTQFACVFSALVHDVDHQGVSNNQLCKEQPHLAEKYREKSVAEQHSIDVAWELLMEPRFEAFRDAIYSNQDELARFRQLVLSAVLATDIFDKEINDHRKQRWGLAFADGPKGKRRYSNEDDCNIKATIVIEHLIQASDVAHTMQHWHIYRKWNQRLFFEMYDAFKAGRMGKNPSEFWYAGELSFFDNYVIPLAKKLKDCNVFGVSSDEYLSYARLNREEWEQKGRGLVASMIESASKRPQCNVKSIPSINAVIVSPVAL